MNYWYVAYALIFFAVILIGPYFAKKWYYKKMMEDLDQGNLNGFLKRIDSFWAKMSFSAFERESLRVTYYELSGQNTKADEQLQFMENMRLSKKQRLQLGERGFYVYLNQGKIKKARHMLDLVKQYGSEQQIQNLEIQYSILLKKESKHIKELIDRRSRLLDASGDVPAGMASMAGTYEYLIGLQYSYEKDWANMKKWFNEALKHVKGTYYEEDINKLLKTAKA